MTFNRNVMIMSDGTNQTIREQTLFRFTYGTSYILEYYDDVNSINEVVEENGQIESFDEVNDSFTQYYLPEENTQYTFPRTKAPAQSKGRSSIITSRSLAPQLLRAYSEIITDLAGAYSTSEKGKIRKATPITGFSTDNDFDFMLHIHYDF